MITCSGIALHLHLLPVDFSDPSVHSFLSLRTMKKSFFSFKCFSKDYTIPKPHLLVSKSHSARACLTEIRFDVSRAICLSWPLWRVTFPLALVISYSAQNAVLGVCSSLGERLESVHVSGWAVEMTVESNDTRRWVSYNTAQLPLPNMPRYLANHVTSKLASSDIHGVLFLIR
jgi:hypothetical protein